MFNTSPYLNQLHAFIKHKKPFLIISAASDLKRSSFLSDLIDWMKQEHFSSIRVNSDLVMSSLIQRITERFIIPVRAVNVSVLQQLKDQADILKQMNQQVILCVEDAHLLSNENLLILLNLVAYCANQKDFSSVQIIFFSKPSLEKKITQTNLLPNDLTLEVIALNSVEEEVVEEEKIVTNQPYRMQQLVSWLFEKRVRLISILLLLLFGVFLYRFDGIRWNQEIKKSEKKNKIHVIRTPQPDLKIESAKISPIKSFPFYLKSNEPQIRYDEEKKLQTDIYSAPNTEHLPMVNLPLPKPTERKSP